MKPLSTGTGSHIMSRTSSKLSFETTKERHHLATGCFIDTASQELADSNRKTKYDVSSSKKQLEVSASLSAIQAKPSEVGVYQVYITISDFIEETAGNVASDYIHIEDYYDILDGITEDPLILAEELSFVRDVFELAITDLSRILDHKRPTIYAWIKGDREPDKQVAIDHIHILYKLAQQWNNKKIIPVSIGKLKNQKLIDDQSFVDLLSIANYDSEKAKEGIIHLYRLLEQKQKRIKLDATKQTESTLSEHEQQININGLTDHIDFNDS